MAVLGIDFGTSYTLVVKKDGDKITIVGDRELYSFADSNSSITDPLSTVKGIRTVIGYTNEGEWVIGKRAFQALETGELLKGNTCFDIKTKLRRILECADPARASVFIDGDGHPISDLSDIPESELFGLYYNDKNGKICFCDAITLANHFFSAFFASTQAIEIENITAIVMGTPANDYADGYEEKSNVASDYQHLVLDKILSNINDLLELSLKEKDLKVRPEPALAGRAYFRTFRSDSENTLVIDIGGGTADFSLICKEGDKLYLPVPTAGNALPAGNTIDDAIENGIRNAFKIDATFDHEIIAEAKESLFMNINSRKISRLADYKYNSKSLEAVSKAFSEYNDHGRRAVVKDWQGETYKLVYSEEHRRGIEVDGLGDWKGDKVFDLSTILYGQDDFNENSTTRKGLCMQLASKVKGYVDNFKKAGYNFHRVLFVGGTSQMACLREYICEYALNLEKNRKGYYDNVHCLGTANSTTRNLTYANMVAIGAAYEAEDSGDRVEVGDMLNSIPELYVQIKDSEDDLERFVLSQSLKNGVFIDEVCDFWPCIEEDYEGGEWVRFKIIEKLSGGSQKIFPYGNNYYGFKLPSDGNRHDVIFIADSSDNGEIAIFVCVLDKPVVNDRNKAYIVGGYNFKILRDSYNGKLSERLSNELCGICGTLEGCRCRKYYISSICSPDGVISQKFIGKKYSIQKNAASDGYGWLMGGNKNG